MDITVYLPDELGKWAKEQGINMSRMLRDELEDEQERRSARQEISAEGFERIEVYDGHRERDVAFQGRQIATAGRYGEQTAYLTEGGRIAVYDEQDDRLFVYDDFASLAADTGHTSGNQDYDLLTSVAEALGEKFTEELDI